MSHFKRSQSTAIQIKKVYQFMAQYGSINRCEDQPIGVCHLAARIHNLEERGLVYSYINQDGIKDFHGIEHKGIRRCFIDWKKMNPAAVEYFAGWSRD
ncbi:MAG: hypothetical protein ACJA0I_001085 [Gammaproteobacteria bacterium]|jgi:hypothetical protein